LIFFYGLSRLPFFLLYFISDLLYWIVYKSFGYRVKVVRQNLKNSFPHKTSKELKSIEKKFYSHLFDVIVETIKLLTISEKDLKKRVSHENPEILTAITEAGGSFVSMAPHLGNWEWILAANKVYLNCEVDAVYKTLNNRFFDRLMLKIRSRFGTFPVPSNQVLRLESARKKIARAIAMVSDQTPATEGSYATLFLNQPTLFFRGPQKISQMFGYPVFYAGIKKLGRGRYHLFVEHIASEPFPADDFIIESFARKLESQIEEDPSIWLWSHKRWKHKVPENLLKVV